LCNNLKNIFFKKAISEKKNTLYICKTGVNTPPAKERWYSKTKKKKGGDKCCYLKEAEK
jgi:hypothetical protein